MIYGVKRKSVALQDKTSTFFDLVPETLQLLELDSENTVHMMEKRVHTPQLLFCTHQPLVPALGCVSAPCYFLPKPSFFPTLWISLQLPIKPNLPLPYPGLCPVPKIPSTNSNILSRTPSPGSPF